MNVLEYGWSPLLLTARNGFVECVRVLLDAKAEVNFAESSSSTAVHLASKYGHVECVRVCLAVLTVEKIVLRVLLLLQLLIDHKARVNARNKTGDLPLHYAAVFGNVSCVKVRFSCEFCKWILDNRSARSSFELVQS